MNITHRAKNIIDSCRFCWMCRHVCPIGNATGQERNTARARALVCSLAVRESIDLSELADNIYECALCGACTNNCITGWDPKVFVQEMKTRIVLEGKAPAYILDLIQTYQTTGNVYGEENLNGALSAVMTGDKSDTAFFAGQCALYKTPQSVADAVRLLQNAGVNVSVDAEQDSGSVLWFLTGKTQETQDAAKKCAATLNAYKTVIVYDPVDLAFIKHEYKEWGIQVSAKVIGFAEYVLGLTESGKLKIKKSKKEYMLQDNYAYARDLDDVNTGRKLIEKAGINKDMLLAGKETNMAGHTVMSQYMPDVLHQAAINRWTNAVNSGCTTLVTQSPAEYVALKETVPQLCRVLSIEQMLAENLA